MNKKSNTFTRLKVFVPLRENQDYTAAEEYGEIAPITPELVDRYNVSELFDTISKAMKDASHNDMILISGLTLSNCIATAIMAAKFGSVNFLLFRKGEYVMRRIILPQDEPQIENVVEVEDGN